MGAPLSGSGSRASTEPCGLGPSGFDPSRSEHGFCAGCGADLDGGSIWKTGLQMALSGALFKQRGQPAPSRADAERLADDYAEAYGAHRTRGQWGRAILYKPEDVYCCPDCGHRWNAPWTGRDSDGSPRGGDAQQAPSASADDSAGRQASPNPRHPSGDSHA